MSFGLNVPKEFLFALPYIMTMLAVSGIIGKATAPAASGTPYDKGEK